MPAKAKPVKKCIICGTEFPTRRGQRYCSPECLRVKIRESHRNWRNRNLEHVRTHVREYARKWRAGEVGNYDQEAVNKKNRERVKAKRHADPETYHNYRQGYYAANRDKILANRREKEGQLPRDQYLEIVRSAKDRKDKEAADAAKLAATEQAAIVARQKADAAEQLVRELRRQTWRPDDWDAWPEDERLVFIMLFEKPDTANDEIGIRLDESDFDCPFGKSWERELTQPGAGATWIWRIRKKITKAMQSMPKG